MAEGEDWLDTHQTPDWVMSNAAGKAAQKGNALEAIKRAQLYLIFESSPIAAQLLKLWQEAVRGAKMAPNATVQEYAAANAVREFIEGIPRQMQLAHNRDNQPQ
jgi:hypothetical protein